VLGNPVNLFDIFGLESCGCSQNTVSGFTKGFHLAASNINPFTSGRGSVHGLINEQIFVGDSGVSQQFYEFEGSGVGLDVGIAFERVDAWGEGAWEGSFRSFNFGYGFGQGSFFWSPGDGDGWIGWSLGVGIDLPGLSYQETNYSLLCR